MAKKYLDLEEAAQQLGISVDEMKRLRENGELRGFADRGTWKFKADDVSELARMRQTDSDPDVPLLDEEPETDSSVVLGAEEGSSVMLNGEGDVVGEQPTVIRQNALEDESGILDGTSDSDVRLILDDSLVGGAADSDPAVEIPSDSDSDVRLVDEAGPSADTGSDSDVKLVGADSDDDVQIIPDESSVIAGSSVIVDDRSDSDVRLIPDQQVQAEAASDSDVQLIGEAPQSAPDSDSDVQLVAPDDGSSVLAGEGGTDVDSSLVSLDDDSGISLQTDVDSGISLEKSADSGISLAPDVDSGISLADDDSGIALEPDVDSGISLADAQDSGIALEADSGIRLADASDSGISLDFGEATGDDGVTETIPVMETPAVDDGEKTELEVPTLDDDGSEFDLAVEADESSDGVDTSVILFDDDDEDDADEYSATAIGGGTPQEQDVFDMREEFGDDDLEVAADVAGEDDELDVFDAVDEDFEDTFDTGESHAEFVAPAAAVGQVAAAVEADWGVGTFLGLLFSTALMLLLGVLVFDLVRSMWTWNEPTGISTTLIGTFGNLF